MSKPIMICSERDLAEMRELGWDLSSVDIRAPDDDAALAAVETRSKHLAEVSRLSERARAAEAQLETERSRWKDELQAERDKWTEERSAIHRAATDGVLPEAEAKIRLAERTRVMEIMAITERGLHAVAVKAIEQGMSVEQFALAQLKEIQDRGITLGGISRDAPPAASHAAPPADAARGGASPFTPDAVARAYANRKAESK